MYRTHLKERCHKSCWAFVLYFIWNLWCVKENKGTTRILSKTLHVSVQFSSVQSLSRVQLFATPWIAARQTSLSITNSGIHPNSCALSRWCHPAISSSAAFFSFCLQFFPTSGSFPMSQLFASGGQCIRVSASTLVLPMNIQDWFLYDGLVGPPCSPRDTQESSPKPQLKSINSSALSFLYSATLTSIHDHWKNHSRD